MAKNTRKKKRKKKNKRIFNFKGKKKRHTRDHYKKKMSILKSIYFSFSFAIGKRLKSHDVRSKINNNKMRKTKTKRFNKTSVFKLIVRF